MSPDQQITIEEGIASMIFDGIRDEVEFVGQSGISEEFAAKLGRDILQYVLNALPDNYGEHHPLY